MDDLTRMRAARAVPAAAATDEVIALAVELEDRVKLGCRAIRSAWVVLAADLFAFWTAKSWEALGYRSFDEWLAGPDIDLRRRHVYRMIEAYRVCVIERGVEPSALEGAPVTKASVVMPAIKRGRATVTDALNDARTLTRVELAEKYAFKPRAADEPWADAA